MQSFSKRKKYINEQTCNLEKAIANKYDKKAKAHCKYFFKTFAKTQGVQKKDKMMMNELF